MEVLVVKAGGGAGVDLVAICTDVAALVASGHPVVLVHGTSAAADALAKAAGIPVRQLTSPSGHVSRYTDPETLELYVAAAAGQVNKQIVAMLQGLGCNAVGLSGVDGRLLVAQRKTAVRAVENGRQRIVRDDYTGKLESANAGLLRLLLDAGYTPVVAPLAIGQEAERLNVDGDRAAALVAAALGASTLVILSNVPGLMANFPDETSVIPHVPPGRMDAAEALAAGRMKKKVLAGREALDAGVARVILGRFTPPVAHSYCPDRKRHLAWCGAGGRLCDSMGVDQINQTAIIDLESRHTSGVYPKRPLAIAAGRGARLWDADGNEYIDCVGGQGAANLGHAHPAITAAIARQAEVLTSCPEIFYNDQRASLLAALTAAAPAGLDRAFLCNSGAEAVEAALKFARLGTGRTEIVATMRGFHGRTLGALSATWEPKYREPFEPLVPGFRHIPYNDLAALDVAVTTQTAAVLLEVVQGEGGVRPGTRDFLVGAQALCRERGALLIVDEIQTGFGRTGRLFACEHTGLEPDLMTVAKSMAGGLPMGACLIGPRVGELGKMTHGSTFGGNPLACAATLATLEVLAGENLPERAAGLGSYLMERLSALDSPFIREVRGLGLLVGVDLKIKVTPILQALQTLGVLALPAGSTVLRLLPPLVIERSDLDRVIDAISAVLAAQRSPVS